jgi:hypothetical protein
MIKEPDEETLKKLAQCAYETYAGMVNATPEDYYSKDILPYEKLSNHSKKHWIDVARAIILASWNIDYGDLE